MPATADVLKQIIYNYYGNTSSEGPIIFAAALSTILVNPIQERISAGRRTGSSSNLFILRDDLPEVVRDMRETASLGEMLDECSHASIKGVRDHACAAIIDQGVFRTRGISKDKVEEWRGSDSRTGLQSDICESDDKQFPLRVPLRPELGRRRTDRLPARRTAAGRLNPKQGRAEGAQGSAGIDRARHPHRDQARGHERRLESLIESNTRRLEELEARLVERPAAFVAPRPTR